MHQSSLKSAEELLAVLLAHLSSDPGERAATMLLFIRSVQRNAIEAASAQCQKKNWSEDDDYADKVLELLRECGPRPETAMTPGPWHQGKGFVYAERGPSGCDDPGNVRAYGGHLIAESICASNLAPIAAVPDLLDACKAAYKEDTGMMCSKQLLLAIAKAHPRVRARA